jgi:hypothetical protein
LGKFIHAKVAFAPQQNGHGTWHKFIKQMRLIQKEQISDKSGVPFWAILSHWQETG